MLDILPHLREDYERWANQIGNDPFQGPRTVGILETLRAHYLIIDYFYQNREGDGIGGIGPKDINLLASAMNRQFSSFGSAARWSHELDVCATLFYGLVKNHAFYDANKRTALLVLLFHLWKLGRAPDIRQKELENLAVRVASNSLRDYKHEYDRFHNKDDCDILFISDFIRKNTREMNKRSYMVTYRELNALLLDFGYKLGNQDRASIDVIKIEERKVFKFRLLRTEKEIIERKLGSIAFPGWTREVKKVDISKVRRLTGLTPEKGFDSDVFFKGASPLSTLIDRYREPLERLANK